MAVTIKDIAKAAQVDKAAVSLTLRNHPEAKRLRPETRERILKAAQRARLSAQSSCMVDAYGNREYNCRDRTFPQE